ncbi:MAG: hypothetical protein IE889_04555 [Campylobacterales bacterium]|nr:hypothetical protein [Campylobacterales bacterium]
MLPLQLHQVLNLLLLLFLGSTTAFLYLECFTILALFLFTLLFEHLLIYFKTKRLDYFSFSSLATAMGVMLMMVTPQWWIYMVVIGAGLLQKHWIASHGIHFFNPSNFAIVIALLFFYQDAHIVLGQLGDQFWLSLVVVVIGIVILWRANRWLIPIVFVAVYLLFQYLWVVAYDPVLVMEEVTHRFYSVSFIVFILFMLTDPRTTPEALWKQAAFALLIALGASLLDRWVGFRVQHLFLSLFLFSLWVPLAVSGQDTLERKALLIKTVGFTLMAIAVIIVIEMQPPYYFDMNG